MNDAKAPAATPSTAVAVPAVPDYLKKMAASDVQNNAMDSMASAAMSIPRVSMRGKKFRFSGTGSGDGLRLTSVGDSAATQEERIASS